MKLVITGGHLTPALSLMDYAISKHDEIVFIGREHSSYDQKIKSQEKAEVENRGAVFESIKTIKIQRHKKIISLLTLPALIKSIIRSYQLLKSHNPDIIVSFGGYMAVPVVLAAKILQIPIFTHEQTHIMGIANKFIARLADGIGISWKNTVGFLPSSKTYHTGNPIRYELKTHPQKPDWISSDKPIIYITGGNQGSATINKIIIDSIEKISTDYYCIHQCGSETEFDILNKAKLTLTTKIKKNYTIRTWFSANEVSWILANALLVIGRSGANTISEIIYKQIPSILIPLPHSGSGEQLQNAKAISDGDAGILILQQNLSTDLLLSSINKIANNTKYYKQNLSKLLPLLISNPEDKIYTILKKLNENKNKKTS